MNNILINRQKKKSTTEDYDSIYKRILYQTIGDIINKVNIKEIAKNIKKDKTEWDHPVFADIKKQLDEHGRFYCKPFRSRRRRHQM